MKMWNFKQVLQPPRIIIQFCYGVFWHLLAYYFGFTSWKIIFWFILGAQPDLEPPASNSRWRLAGDGEFSSLRVRSFPQKLVETNKKEEHLYSSG